MTLELGLTGVEMAHELDSSLEWIVRVDSPHRAVPLALRESNIGSYLCELYSQ